MNKKNWTTFGTMWTYIHESGGLVGVKKVKKLQQQNTQ